MVATGQLTTVGINTVSLLPQFWHNYATKTKGDYSPVTAGLATAGCVIRIFTTVTLNGSDPLLMITFLSAALLNSGMLAQIIYYGKTGEGLTLAQVLLSDVVTPNTYSASAEEEDVRSEVIGNYNDLV